MTEFKAHFKSVQPDLGGSLPGQLIFGIPGKDGFSPIAKVTQTDDGAVITITDKNGTTEAVVKNGKVEVEIPEAGGTGNYSELINKPKINGVELDGEKSLEDLGIGQPTDEQIGSAVSAYLEEHPEATTTVKDKSITEEKLADSLKEKISPTYKNFKAVFLGDSNTAINTCKNKPWWKWVVELLGITNYVNYGQNGATLTTLGKTATPICERCKNMDADASMIFVMGGVNEFRQDTQSPFGTVADTTPETICGAVRYICRELQKKYPKTPIIFITPTNQRLWTHKDGHSMADLAKAIMDACHMEGVLCLDAQGSLGVNPAIDSSYVPDGVHLNDLGSELLGKWVVNQVRLHVPILSSSPNGGGSGGEVEPEEPDTEKTLSSISATYSGGSVTAGTAVNDLTGIVVIAHYSDGTSEAVTGYSLSGTIAEGENTITVSYGGKTTTFTVTGVADSSGGDGGNEPTVPDADGYVNLADHEYTSGYFVNEKGEIKNGSAMMYSAMIPVPANTEITYMNDVLTNPVFFDADKNFISANQANTGYTLGTPKEFTVTTPANCAYAVFNMTVQAGIDKYYVKWGKSSGGGESTEPDTGGDSGGETGEYVTLNMANYDIEDGYVSAGGQIQGQGSWTHTEKIPIPANKEIVFCCNGRLNPVYYDTSGNIMRVDTLPAEQQQGVPKEHTLITPENCGYIAMNIAPDTTDRSVLYIKYPQQ